MLTESRKSFDLGPVTRALFREKSKVAKAAAQALQSFRDARSAIHDLHYAWELLEFLTSEDHRDGAGPLPVSARGTFLSNAILMYVRATEPGKTRKGRGRNHLKVRRRLTPDQQVLHDELAIIRNKSIAHLDPDGPFDDRSYDEDVLILVDDEIGGQRFEVACRRLVYQGVLEEKVRQLARAAISAGWEEVHEREAEAAEKLREASRADLNIARLIQKFPFDAVRFFGSEGLADDFLKNGMFREAGSPERDQFIFEGWPTRSGR